MPLGILLRSCKNQKMQTVLHENHCFENSLFRIWRALASLLGPSWRPRGPKGPQENPRAPKRVPQRLLEAPKRVLREPQETPKSQFYWSKTTGYVKWRYWKPWKTLGVPPLKSRRRAREVAKDRVKERKNTIWHMLACLIQEAVHAKKSVLLRQNDGLR